LSKWNKKQWISNNRCLPNRF